MSATDLIDAIHDLEHLAHQQLPDAAPRTPSFHRPVSEHFDADPTAFPTRSETLGVHDRPNVHLAVEAHLAGSARRVSMERE